MDPECRHRHRERQASGRLGTRQPPEGIETSHLEVWVETPQADQGCGCRLGVRRELLTEDLTIPVVPPAPHGLAILQQSHGVRDPR